MKEEKLVRCRPCGYVMKESELGDVCPACGLPRDVFEPYREKVSAGRLRFLALDIHPIAIHLSQTFVALVPFLIIFNYLFPNFEPIIIHSVIAFSVYVFPLTLILSAISGYADGLVRFKTIKTPLLMIYAPDDQVVSPAASAAAFPRWGAANKQQVLLEHSQDNSHHILAGRIVAPRDTPRVAALIEAFLLQLGVTPLAADHAADK